MNSNVFAASNKSSSKEYLHRKLFGSKPQIKEIPTSVFLYIDDTGYRNVPIWVYSVGYDFKIEAVEFFRKIVNNLSQEGNAFFGKKIGSQLYITREELEGSGLLCDFKPEVLTLKISIPPHYRKLQVIDLNPGIPETPDSLLLRPGLFNGFSNVYYFQHSDRDTSITAFKLENSVNFGKLTLQADLNYDTTYDSEAAYIQSPGILINNEKQMLSYRAGVLRTRGIGFQSRLPMVGLQVYKDFTLQSNYNFKPQYRHKLVVKEPGRLTVSVNEHQLLDQAIDAGNYEIVNFPFSSGTNQIRIRLIDSQGQETEFKDSFIYDYRLLNPGEDEFGCSVGYPKVKVGMEELATMTEPIINYNYRTGISPSLTGGIYYSQYPEQMLFGGVVEDALEHGLLIMGLGVSRFHDSLNFGLGYQVAFYSYPGQIPGLNSLSISYEKQNSDFYLFQADQSSHSESDSFAVNASVKLEKQFVCNARLFSFKNGRTNDSNHGFIVSFAVVLNPRERTDFQYKDTLALAHTVLSSEYDWHSLDNRNKLNASTEFHNFNPSRDYSLIWRYRPDGRLNTNSYFDIGDTYNSFSNQSTITYGGWWVREDFRISNNNPASPLGESYSDMNLLVSTPRGFVRVANKGGTGDQLFREETEVSLETAIVFADGQWAISKPVNQTFVLVYPHPTMRNVPFSVNSSTFSDLFGPAVISDIGLNRIEDVVVDLPETIPHGLRMARTAHKVRLEEGSGVGIQVGAGYTVILQGRLLDNRNAPIGYFAGQFERLDSEDGFTNRFFTLKKGEFQVSGMKPGQYRLILFKSDYVPLKLTVPENQSGIYNIGDLILNENQSY